jgi:hypothetical protein
MVSVLCKGLGGIVVLKKVNSYSCSESKYILVIRYVISGHFLEMKLQPLLRKFLLPTTG